MRQELAERAVSLYLAGRSIERREVSRLLEESGVKRSRSAAGARRR